MGSKDGGYVDSTLFAQRYGYTSQPFMEMSNYSSFGIVANILHNG
jgi:hypothetical protein